MLNIKPGPQRGGSYYDIKQVDLKPGSKLKIVFDNQSLEKKVSRRKKYLYIFCVSGAIRINSSNKGPGVFR